MIGKYECKEIFDNYEPFFNALVACTVLSNDSSDAYKRDAKKIVSLVCSAYDLSDKTRKAFDSAIFGTLCQVTTLSDCAAVKKNEGDSDRSEEDVLLYLKSTVLESLHNISQTMNFGPYQDRDCFDYTYVKPYQENMRYSKINRAASCGIVVATREAAIMQFLGIGCERDADSARRRLINCVYWGDIFSVYLLAELYRSTDNREKYEICKKVAELCDKYLHTGCTVLSDEEKLKYGSEACDDYALISTILQDVIYANNLVRIDFSFIEAINSSELDYYQRMKFVNQYVRREWQEVTNASTSPSRKIGFR